MIIILRQLEIDKGAGSENVRILLFVITEGVDLLTERYASCHPFAFESAL